ncbi:MAG: aminotransferase class I/II-fold pyridoxal phosphate-dependent enzyme [Acetobacteraceae bacterium]|nr:aminotransferase class I/II-fold pyridoxal phosphate-dependent enzyme [Acetobacteraceae bacterium]
MDGKARTPFRASERIWLSPPDQTGTEQLLLAQVVASNWIAPAGPALVDFEEAIANATGMPHVVALSSGTAALHLACHLAGVRRGDRVWTSTLTFVATITGACQLGAEPGFLDVDQATWTLDPALLDQALREAARARRLPRAVIAVDLYGQPADIRRLGAACAEHGVTLIADSAEGFGASQHGSHAGRGARMTAFSFNGNKILTCGGGGALASEDQGLVLRARHLATQAREPAPHYEHLELGYNFRLSNLLAAVGVAQLSDLDRRVARRRQIFDRYAACLGELPGIAFMPEAPWARSSRWLSVMLVDRDRFGAGPETLRTALEAANIESRPVWKPMHRQPVFAGAFRMGGGVADTLFDRGLCLPSSSGLSDAHQDRVIEVIRAVHLRALAA